MNISKVLKRFWSEEEGLTMVEYAVAAAVIAAGAITAFQLLGTNVSTKVNTLANTIGST